MGLPTMESKSTHLKMLVRYVLQAPAGKPIVEMGCGYYSTLVLNEICRTNLLHFHVYYSDSAWKDHVASMVGNVTWHYTDWEDWECPEAFVTLLDNEQSVAERAKHLPMLLERSAYVVIHDANWYNERADGALTAYEDRIIDYDFTVPHTAVLIGGK